MTLLNDKQIAQLAENDIFMPYCGEKTRILDNGIKAISFGLSQGGYDIRLSPQHFQIVDRSCTKKNGDIDAKAFDLSRVYDAILNHDHNGSFYRIPPSSYGIGTSLERFTMPDNIMGLVFGKSTYARCGLIANITPIEPGWSGHLTMALINTTSFPMRVYANEGIAQVVLFDCGSVAKSYEGPYQNQSATVQLAAV